ncbi:eceriferum 3-like protein [Tanacetum coccineum]
MGKWTTPREQRWAPPGTHFHQFVFPPVFELRRDCTYSKLAAMKLPHDVEGPGSCEFGIGQWVKWSTHKFDLFHESIYTLILGKWTTPREQRWSPPGTYFHQFVVPPVFKLRRDYTYSKLTAVKLPDDVEGLGSCEVPKKL